MSNRPRRPHQTLPVFWVWAMCVCVCKGYWLHWRNSIDINKINKQRQRHQPQHSKSSRSRGTSVRAGAWLRSRGQRVDSSVAYSWQMSVAFGGLHFWHRHSTNNVTVAIYLYKKRSNFYLFSKRYVSPYKSVRI